MIKTCKPKNTGNNAKSRQRVKWSGKCAEKKAKFFWISFLFFANANIKKRMAVLDEMGKEGEWLHCSVQINMKVSHKNESKYLELSPFCRFAIEMNFFPVAWLKKGHSDEWFLKNVGFIPSRIILMKLRTSFLHFSKAENRRNEKLLQTLFL